MSSGGAMSLGGAMSSGSAWHLLGAIGTGWKRLALAGGAWQWPGALGTVCAGWRYRTMHVQ